MLKKILKAINKQKAKRYLKAMEEREKDIKQKMEKDPEFKRYIEETQKEEAELKDSYTRKPKAIKFQKDIMNKLVCPLCNNKKFLDLKLSASKDSLSYRYTIQSYKICKRCGFMIRYYDFNNDFDTNNFDAEDDSIYLNKITHS